ncbi:tetratricopeptide repeat 17 [Labeo rohita]|uniref:Tetratricopeptide repeat 17 n=1 Tax=Labeo rohita TaxID=84645 RepID=A0A498MQH8_LABRO|nr:tetratricopeptide repeat 17 [Labeo rohita]
MIDSLRLLCLLSITENGLLSKDYKSLKAQYFQSYGIDHLLTFANLRQLGLLEEQQAGETLTVMESKVGKLVNDKTVGKLTDAFSSLAKKSNFRALSKRLALVPKSGEEYDLRVPRDMAYIFSGAYIPLSCKLIEQVLERDGWTGLEEVTRMLNGQEFAVTGGSSGSEARNKTDAQRIVLVMFLGGCTFSEISALRFLGKERDIWEEIGIPEDQRLERTNVVKNHVKSLLDMMIAEEESLRKRLMTSIEKCQKELSKLCLELQLPPFQPFSISPGSVPSLEQLEKFRQHISTLTAEKERRHNEFVTLKKQIILCMDDLDQLPETSFEKDVVCEDEESFCLSTENIDSLKVLLHQLQAEVKRLEELKIKNIQNVTEAIRNEIAVFWDKCFYSADQRQAFVPYYDDDFSEELLSLHDAEIVRLKQYYEDHKDLFEGVHKWEESWRLFLELEEKAKDPTRFTNRGGNLLKEEKQRADLVKGLPKLEKKLKAEIEQWEHEQNREFQVNGQKFMQFVTDQWETYRLEKEREKQERQLKKSKQTEEDMVYGTVIRTPTKRRFLGSTTPCKARKLNATSSTGTSNSTIRSVFGGTVCHSPVSRPPISASKQGNVKTPGHGKPPHQGLQERNKENICHVPGMTKVPASPQRNFSINSVASTYSEFQKQLVAQKIHIEENEDRDTGLEQRHYKEDADCVTAKVPLGDLDLYDGTFISLESKDINPEEFLDQMSPLPPDLEKPDCAKILDLPYSIHAFQHLRGVQEKVNLTSPLLSKDDPIFTSLSLKLGQSVDEVGHRIHQALLKNSSSWVLYNLASFYWRMKNEPRRAVDCVVRALHFSPRQHKDVALINMANILHRAHFSADAAILAHAALDLTTDLLTSHYTLGNIYAMLGEYNHSVLCYEQALQAQPGFEQALRRKHAVLCQQKLEQRLEAQHRSLQRTLNELKEYQKQHDHYLRQQEMLDKHKLIQEEQILRNIIHETQMAKEAQLGNHQMCHMGQQKFTLHCPFDLPVRYHRGELFENVHYIQESHTVLWPRRSDCAQRFPTIPPVHLLPTYYLPPESRSFKALNILLESKSPPPSTKTPDCSLKNLVTARDPLDSLAWALEKELPDRHAAEVLLKRSGGKSLDQTGALIAQALDKMSGPRWMMQNEAGLFWRAKGNGTQALACLRQALHSAPPQHRDMPLVNTANLLLHYGLHEEAHELLQQALQINRSEGNLTGALAVFRGALTLTVHCSQCRASLPLMRCLQFYPFLYNLQHEACPSGSGCETEEDTELEEWDTASSIRQEAWDTDAMPVSALEDSLLFEKVVVDSNGSGEASGQDRAREQKTDGVEEEEQDWRLREELIGAFEGALDMNGKTGDLRGIRVLKNDRVMGARAGGPCFGNCEDDEGAEWITFQVKRVKKPKTDTSEGWVGEGDVRQGESAASNSILEISGPTIPSPGPSERWKDYSSLGWPGPEECQRTRRVDLTTVASTWLAVSAKNIDITEHIDFATPLQEPAVEPVLQNLGKDKFPSQSFEQVGTRIAKVLEKNQTSWVLSSMAALYWRVKGQGKRAIDCLRQALNYAPHHMKDVPLISLANIFQNARLWEDALTVARMAVEIAPHFVVNHFTLANVYIAMEEFEKAMHWYESTLKLQPEFGPAKDRLRTIQCYLLSKRDRRAP